MNKIFLIVCFILLTAIGTSSCRDINNGQVSPFEIDKLKNTKAPDFSLKNLNGKDITLSSLKGKIVLLNFWATWCPPCKSEMLSLNRLYKDMKSRGFEILAVSTDNSINYVKEYISKNSFDFQILWDEDRVVSKKYTVFSMPTTFLIDRKGIIVEKFMGEYDWTDPEIKKKIEKL